MRDKMSGCDCDDPSLVPVIDMNLAPSYKQGNKFCRYCRNCNRRYFCGKRYFRKAQNQYVIPKGEDEPIEGFLCPNPDCDEIHIGAPDACDACGEEFVYEDEDDERPADHKEQHEDDPEVESEADTHDEPEGFECPHPDCDAYHVGQPDECDECGAEYVWETESSDDQQEEATA